MALLNNHVNETMRQNPCKVCGDYSKVKDGNTFYCAKCMITLLKGERLCLSTKEYVNTSKKPL